MNILLFIVIIAMGSCAPKQKGKVYPSIYATPEEQHAILEKIDSHDWAKSSWINMLDELQPYVDRHQSDPEWIVSRLAMYWEEGAHYTQCYIKKQDWDYGEGNAPVPTVRLPGMRRWNDYVNVPLEDRIPYNKSGDMLGISRSSGDPTPVLVPYKKSGHMIRQNNMEILKLAEKAAFAYYVTKDEKYAKFSSDILWTWLLGTYYMQPPLDPEKSSKGPGGYEPGGILGYYDYEVIHDDRQDVAASTYDFLHDYMCENEHPHLKEIGKNTTQMAGEVFKRFIEIDLVRGGKKGNWNVNRYRHLMNSILVLEPNDFYEDGKGREYYIPFYTEIETDYLDPLPNIMSVYDSITGLWPESPGYASSMIPTVMQMGIKLYKNGVNTMAEYPIIPKAAMGNLGWLDARGNLVVFGDMRGGPSNISVFENLLTYYTLEGDMDNAKTVSAVIRKAVNSGQYSREHLGVEGLCLNKPLVGSSSDLPFHRAAYSPFHRHIIMKNKNDEEKGMMFTLYGGRKGSHLSDNGLALQFYGKGWALAPDGAAYESYWTPDFKYYHGATGANTIVPGYTKGPITVEAMDPKVDDHSFYNREETSPNCSFADVSAAEKRRLVAMVRTSETSGYYVDIFRSDQDDNDYIHHNLGNTATLLDADGKALNLKKVNDLGTAYSSMYEYFKNQRKVAFSNDFVVQWHIGDVSPALYTDMWMMGQVNRQVYLVDAPPTTIREDVTPGQMNKAPQNTPTLIVRQTNNNAKNSPFVAVFEAYNEGEKSISEIQKVVRQDCFVCVKVRSKNGSTQHVFNAIDDQVYKASKDLEFQGSFGICSQNKERFEYLYLGRGKKIKIGNYQLQAVGATVSAELRAVDGKLYYSADAPVLIQKDNTQEKEYPSGYNILID
ncbi:hypothetical protein [Saccharicrinis fermentans]|uniref:hypothetical protein n=1 Tax=Saccharicrinis fermentans TaxID=982 RepID=UPI00126889A7|nr:hypothetical protein [Saccharicrinis fermentans]